MDSYTNGGGGFDTNTSPDRPRKSYGDQSLVPVTIHQIHAATSDAAGPESSVVLSDGRALTLCKLVGAVRTMEEHSTNLSYQIEDGTGLIVAKQWLDANDAGQVAMLQEMKETVRDHVYVRVIGTVREYDQKRTVMVQSLRKCGTANELTHHMLEVVHSSLKYKTSGNGNGNFGVGGGAGDFKPMHNIGGAALHADLPVDRDDSLGNEIIHAIQQNTRGDDGAHLSSIVSFFGGRKTEDEVKQKIFDMTNDGAIYSTIDENHYATC